MPENGNPEQRGVLTMAAGPSRYLKQAVNLALSVKRHSPGVKIAIVTDCREDRLRALFDDVVPIAPERGNGYRQKLYVETYSPYVQTLFIDSDCLVMRSLLPLFDYMSGRPFSIIGDHIDTGFWYADVKSFCAKLGVARLPKFNSGVFYTTRGAAARTFFEVARDIYDRLPELEVAPTHRGQVGDEPAIAAAMALSGFEPLPTPGLGFEQCHALFAEFEGVDLDILKGVCRFRFVGQQVEPTIAHFVAGIHRWAEYRRESMRLRLADAGKLSPSVDAAVKSMWSIFRLMQVVKRRTQRIVSSVRIHLAPLCARASHAGARQV